MLHSSKSHDDPATHWVLEDLEDESPLKMGDFQGRKFTRGYFVYPPWISYLAQVTYVKLIAISKTFETHLVCISQMLHVWNIYQHLP